MENPIAVMLKKDWEKAIVNNKKLIDGCENETGLQECVLLARFKEMLVLMEQILSFINDNMSYISWVPCDKFQPSKSGCYLVTLGSSATSYEYFSHSDNEWRSSLTGFPVDVRAWAERPDPFPFWENEEWWKRKYLGETE